MDVYQSNPLSTAFVLEVVAHGGQWTRIERTGTFHFSPESLLGGRSQLHMPHQFPAMPL